MNRPIADVIAHAAINGGVITRSEALALGMTSSTLGRRVDEGILIRLSYGVFALPGSTLALAPTLTAACRKLGAVVSHQSAATLHDLARFPSSCPTVSVAHRRTHLFEGAEVHQLTDLIDEHIVQINGLPVTTPERTVIDLAAVLRPGRLEYLLDNGIASGKIDLDRLAEIFSSVGRRGKPGTARLRKSLERRVTGPQPTATELEIRLMDLIRRAGLPNPTSQFRAPWLKPINGRVDFAYEDHRLLIEGDSRRWHTLLNSFEVDRERDNAATLAGWRTLRFTWSQITETPDRVVAAIRSGLELERI